MIIVIPIQNFRTVASLTRCRRLFHCTMVETRMGYRIVDPETIEPVADRPCELRRLSEPAQLSSVALNQFRAAPGEQIPLAYHYHEEQQEAFYVLSGTLSVETPEKEISVSAGSLFVADAESPHRAYNPADATADVTVLALGTPAVSGDAFPSEPDNE